MRNGIMKDTCIIVYTHSNSNKVWKPYFGRLEKHANGIEVFALSNTDDIKNYVKSENCYIYKEEESFTQSWLNAFAALKIDKYKYFVYNQEDFILYDDINVEMLNEAKALIEDGINNFTKLIKSGHSEFCFQSTLNNIEKYKKFISKYPIEKIWDEAYLSAKSTTEYRCNYMPEEWVGFKRGMFHYDSKIWPYIATALNKGKWNTHEYPYELDNIFSEYKMNISQDTAIIVRGLSNDVESVRQCYKNYAKNIIFSTWEGSQSQYRDDENVVYSNQPIIDGPKNFIVQRTTTLAGLDYAKKNNYKNAIVIRFDTLFEPAEEIINLFDFNKLNFLCWHQHPGHPPGYIVDYIVAGPIDYVREIWNVHGHYCSPAPEVILTSKYMHFLSDKIEVKFILKDLNNTRDIYWKKYNVKLKNYKDSPEYTSMDGIEFSDREKFINYIK